MVHFVNYKSCPLVRKAQSSETDSDRRYEKTKQTFTPFPRKTSGTLPQPVTQCRNGSTSFDRPFCKARFRQTMSPSGPISTRLTLLTRHDWIPLLLDLLQLVCVLSRLVTGGSGLLVLVKWSGSKPTSSGQICLYFAPLQLTRVLLKRVVCLFYE